MLPTRRSLLRGLSLGAATGFLSPVMRSLTQEARGAEPARKNLFVLTAGNGWGHQGMERNSPLLSPTNIRSPSDWDIADVLKPMEPLKARLSVCRPLKNPFDRNLHGNGWATLSMMRGDGANPGGVSVDRYVALNSIAAKDPFPSVALGVALRDSSPPACASCDGPRKPYPAIGRPLVAYETLFGSAAGQGDAEKVLAARDSLLDGMVADVERARQRLAGEQRLKLDQLLDSYRALENQLAAKRLILSKLTPPAAPSEKQNALGLNVEAIRAHVDIAAHAVAFGLTHVVHLSVLGFNDHNAGWGALGFEGDAHENVAHVSGYTKEKSTAAYQAILTFEAELVARFYQTLAQFKTGDSLVSDNTFALWVNSAGGKHHDGGDTHAVVMVTDTSGSVKGGQFLDKGGHTVSEAFLPVINAMGVKTDVFGDPAYCKGPVPGLV